MNSLFPQVISDTQLDLEVIERKRESNSKTIVIDILANEICESCVIECLV